MTKNKNLIVAEDPVEFLRSCLKINRKKLSAKKISKLLNLLYLGNMCGDKLEEKTIAAIKENITERNIDNWTLLEKACSKNDSSAITEIFKNIWYLTEQKTAHYYKEVNKINDDLLGLIIGENPPPKKHLLADTEGPYGSEIFKALHTAEGSNISEKLTKTKLLFIDILKHPIPIGASIRKKWTRDFTLVYNGKKISMPTALLQISLEPFNGNINKNIPVAIMIPPLTADGIYLDALEQRLENLNKSILCTNTLKDKKKLYKLNVGGNDYKSKTIFRANTPNHKLIQHALGLL